VEGSCGHGNAPSGSVKCWEILEQLSDWPILKKCPAPWITEHVGIEVTLGKFSVRLFSGTFAVLFEVLGAFPQFLQTNAGITF
jgi:hypothetical protein